MEQLPASQFGPSYDSEDCGSPRQSLSGLRIGLLHLSDATHEDTAAIFAELFSERGATCHQVRCIEDCRDDLDLLVAYGPIIVLPDFRRIIARLRILGIFVIFWLIEPILPGALDDHALRTVRAAAPIMEKRGIFRIGKLRKIWRRRLCARLRRQLAATGAKGWHHLNDERIVHFCASYQWIRDAYVAGEIGRIVVSLRYRQIALHEAGIPADYAPYGYHPSIARQIGDVPRDIDVLFIGIVNKTRQDALDRIGPRLRHSGRELMAVTGNCWGNDRIELMNRSKIVLNLLNYPWEFPAMRLVLAAGCGCLFISESGPDTHPYRPGEHFVQSARDDLAETLLYYLDHEEARCRIAEQGYRFVTRHMTMQNTIIPEIEQVVGMLSEAET